MDRVMFKEKKNALKRNASEEKGDFSWIINAIFVVVSAFLIFNSFRSVQLMNQKLDILDRAQREVGELRLRNISLILEKEKIETDDFTESDIRNRLNYSKKNEIVFVIPEDILELSRKEVGRILEVKKEEAITKSTWEVWKELFIYGI